MFHIKLLRLVPLIILLSASHSYAMNGAKKPEILTEVLNKIYFAHKNGACTCGHTDIDHMIAQDNLNLAMRLITPETVNIPDKEGHSPLVVAICVSVNKLKNTHKIIHYICEQGGLINKQVGNFVALKFGALFAAKTGVIEPFKILMQHGGDPFYRADNSSFSAWESLLDLTYERKNSPFVYEVLDFCVQRSNSLHHAARGCNPEKMEQLIAAGTSATEKDECGKSPLVHLIRYGSFAPKMRVSRCIAILLAAGVKPDERVSKELPAYFSYVHMAVTEALERKKCRVLKPLLACGASPLASGDLKKANLTPLDIAKHAAFTEGNMYGHKVLRVLEEHMPRH